MKTVLRCGELFTGLEKKTLKNVDIVVENGKILSVEAASADLPTDAEFVDLGDKFVTPGFIDLHTHIVMDGQIDPFNEMLFTSHAASTIDGVLRAQRDLLAGFTTIRDCGGSRTGDAIAVRDAINKGKISGPRMLVSGPYLVTSAQYTLYEDGGLTFDGPVEAKKVARKVVQSGADQIKFIGIGHVSVDELAALKEVAQECGKLTSYHATDALTIRKAATVGPDSIEHALEIDQESVDLCLKNDTAIIPTFCPYYFSAVNAEEVYGDPVNAARRVKQFETHCKHFPWLISEGVKIGFGADTGATLTKHGQQGIEMSLMHDAGMSEMDVLWCATYVNARILHMEDRIGAVAPGMCADIAAFDKSLLDDIKEACKCSFVMKDGVIYKGENAVKLQPLS